MDQDKSIHQLLTENLIRRNPDGIEGIKRFAHYVECVNEADYAVIPAYVSRGGVISGDLVLVAYGHTDAIDLFLLDRRGLDGPRLTRLSLVQSRPQKHRHEPEAGVAEGEASPA